MDFQHTLNRLKAAGASLSGPQLATLAVAFIAVVGLTIGSAYWLNAPTYGVLFTDMDPDTAASVVTKLKTDKVAYLLDEGGRTVRVPAANVDELRLELAGQGMPASGRVGFEIFDRTAFGVTDFLEHVNYRRALEGELARTIASIGDVASARVHLAMPRESLFVNQEQPAKASVVLKLKSNRPLPASTVNAITGLVAASVESLRPESVVVLDNYGRSLAHASSTDESSGPQTEKQQRLEHEMASRVVALLNPILGEGHVRVNVNARLDGGSTDETEERWDPTPVMRSRQSMTQVAGATGGPGVSGARANTPADPKAPKAPETTVASASAPGPGHTAETTNYELGRVTTHRLMPRGELSRLSVAVVVDDDHEMASEGGKTVRRAKRRSPADIQKVHDLVAASVGLDVDRGDQLIVENIAFEEAPIEEAPPPAGKWQQYGPQVLEVGKLLGIVAIGLFALLGVVRPTVQRVMSPAALPAGVTVRSGALGAAPAALRTVEDLEGEIEAELQAAGNLGTARRLPVLTRRVAAMTQREPENTARLLRTWLSEDDR